MLPKVSINSTRKGLPHFREKQTPGTDFKQPAQGYVIGSGRSGVGNLSFSAPERMLSLKPFMKIFMTKKVSVEIIPHPGPSPSKLSIWPQQILYSE